MKSNAVNDAYIRLAVIEDQIKTLVAHNAIMASHAEARDKKIDELLDLKNRGVGAFWLASLIMGSATVTALLTFVDWLKGTHL